MEVGVGVGGEVVVDGQIDALDVDTTAENVGGNTDALVELFEFLVAFDAGRGISAIDVAERKSAYRSSWLTPEWTAIEGKLHSRSNLSSSVARRVDLTKMMT